MLAQHGAPTSSIFIVLCLWFLF